MKKTKYCIIKRGDKIVENNKSFICIGCKKIYMSKQNLNIHTENCINMKVIALEDKYNNTIQNFEKTIHEQKQTIKDLQDKLENIALKAISRPTQQINNKQVINLAPFDLTPEKAKIIFDTKYTTEYFLQGMKGLVSFVSDHILKTDTGESIYACYDRSRDVFKYKNEAGEYINDIKAIRLVEIIHPAAKETGWTMNVKFNDEYMAALSEYDEDKTNNITSRDELERKEIKSHQALDSFFIHNYLNTELDSFSSELGDKIKK
jgi:hypothetical protein